MVKRFTPLADRHLEGIDDNVRRTHGSLIRELQRVRIAQGQLFARRELLNETDAVVRHGMGRDARHTLGAARPGVFAFTAAVSDTCTLENHGMRTGYGPVTCMSSDTLPAGLSSGVDYWAIRLSADTFQLATSHTNAETSTQVNITTTGTGQHILDLSPSGIGRIREVYDPVRYDHKNVLVLRCSGMGPSVYTDVWVY